MFAIFNSPSWDFHESSYQELAATQEFLSFVQENNKLKNNKLKNKFIVQIRENKREKY